MNYYIGKTFNEVCYCLNIPAQMAERIFSQLRKEDYSERAICYAANKSYNKLNKFIGDNRFESIFINEVRKHSFKIHDERWAKFNRKGE